MWFFGLKVVDSFLWENLKIAGYSYTGQGSTRYVMWQIKDFVFFFGSVQPISLRTLIRSFQYWYSVLNISCQNSKTNENCFENSSNCSGKQVCQLLNADYFLTNWIKKTNLLSINISGSSPAIPKPFYFFLSSTFPFIFNAKDKRGNPEVKSES